MTLITKTTALVIAMVLLAACSWQPQVELYDETESNTPLSTPAVSVSTPTLPPNESPITSAAVAEKNKFLNVLTLKCAENASKYRDTLRFPGDDYRSYFNADKSMCYLENFAATPSLRNGEPGFGVITYSIYEVYDNGEGEQIHYYSFDVDTLEPVFTEIDYESWREIELELMGSHFE